MAIEALTGCALGWEAAPIAMDGSFLELESDEGRLQPGLAAAMSFLER